MHRHEQCNQITVLIYQTDPWACVWRSSMWRWQWQHCQHKESPYKPIIRMQWHVSLPFFTRPSRCRCWQKRFISPTWVFTLSTHWLNMVYLQSSRVLFATIHSMDGKFTTEKQNTKMVPLNFNCFNAFAELLQWSESIGGLFTRWKWWSWTDKHDRFSERKHFLGHQN